VYRLITYPGFESPSLRQNSTKCLSSLENPDKSKASIPAVHDKWYTEDSESLKNKPGLVSRNGTYYARVRVPTLLVGLLQKHEIKISLRTKNLNEARAKLPNALVEINKQLAAATKVADAVAAPAEEVRRGTLERIARTWFEPRWRATGESLWKPIPAGVTAEDALCNIDPELARLSPPDEVTLASTYMRRAACSRQPGFLRRRGAASKCWRSSWSVARSNASIGAVGSWWMGGSTMRSTTRYIDP
jgi:hypothetical protein